MGLAKAGRQRLLLGAIAVFAFGMMVATAPAANNKPPLVGGAPCAPPTLRGAPDASPNTTAVASQDTLRLARSSATFDALAVSHARDACAAAQTTQRGRASIDAYACVADAWLLLGQHEQNAQIASADYSQAACAYSNVSFLQGRANPAIATSESQFGLATALDALHTLGGPGAGDYLSQAIAAYRQAATTPDRTFTLGQALAESTLPSDRTEAISTFQRVQTSDPALAAGALMEQIRVRRLIDPNYAPDLQTQGQLAPYAQFADVNTLLGRMYFKQGSYGQAAGSFGQVIASPNSRTRSLADGTNYLAEAWYYTSVIEARGLPVPQQPVPTLQDTVDRALRAVTAGGSDPKYRIQVCLSKIALGGDALGADSASCALDSSPQGALLLGMYHLRRAQFYNKGDAVMHLGPARDHFLQEMGAAQSAFLGATAAAAVADVSLDDWPNADQARALVPPRTPAAPVFKASEMLRYGVFVVSQCSTPNPLPQPDMDAIRPYGRAFFDRYHVYDCKLQ